MKRETPSKFPADMLLTVSLAAADGAAINIYGGHMLINVLVCVAICFGADLLLTVIRAKHADPYDMTVVCTGLAIAGMMSPAAPWKVCIYAAVFAMCVRHITGDIFPPAAVGYIFAELSFPSSVLRYPRPGIITDMSPDTMIRSADINTFLDDTQYSGLDILIGRIPGPAAAGSAILIGVCAVVLICARRISLTVLLTGTIPVLISMARSGIGAAEAYLGGMYLFVLVFIIADKDYLPQRKLSCVLYGLAVSAVYMIAVNISQLSFPIVYAVILTAPLRYLEKPSETPKGKTAGKTDDKATEEPVSAEEVSA
ncbi:MAG: RnfABCDGE type electron transport complex subunit D [Oscillospiraceae bacterium]|nr:RnfABCDGE type electron transport complex subunit D [Oscillospiraceae bacterium]